MTNRRQKRTGQFGIGRRHIRLRNERLRKAPGQTQVEPQERILPPGKTPRAVQLHRLSILVRIQIIQIRDQAELPIAIQEAEQTVGNRVIHRIALAEDALNPLHDE